MAQRRHVTEEVYASRLAVLQELFAGQRSVQVVAEKLATLSLSADSTEEGLGITWSLILASARDEVGYQEKLTDVLLEMSQLPNAQDDRGESLTVHNMRVWRDLPTLGWEFNYEWNGLDLLSQPGPEREQIIMRFVNANKFAARLMATGEPVFAFSFFALVTMRTALEIPVAQLRSDQPLDAFLPAAAAWIALLGSEIYGWDEEFEQGPLVGAKGRGGPLWQEGKHGFCEERWKLWRERFGELAEMENAISEEVKGLARQAEERMSQIESKVA